VGGPKIHEDDRFSTGVNGFEPEDLVQAAQDQSSSPDKMAEVNLP
jgi:hypothetical protein